MAAMSQGLRRAIRTAIGSESDAAALITTLESTILDLSAAELAFIDGAIAGTPAADKALIVGTSLALGTVGTATFGNIGTDTITVASTKSAIITTADKLTVGGVIVPAAEILVSYTIPLHASKVIYNLFVARDAWQITHIDYTPDVAQGGALTATIVKAITTATPASATTPMHIAGAVDLNAVAHTVQPITVTETAADLVLAAGNRIAIVLSGAMTAGSGLVTIRGKRV